MATFSSSAHILCIWVPLSLLQLQSNLSGECKFETQDFRSCTKWFCCHIPFILVWSISFDTLGVVSGVRTHQMVPHVMCHVSVNVRTLSSLSGNRSSCVQSKIKGNSPKISLKRLLFLSLICVVWHLVYWWMMNSEGGIHNMPFLNGFIMKHNDLFVFCNTYNFLSASLDKWVPPPNFLIWIFKWAFDLEFYPITLDWCFLIMNGHIIGQFRA